jgi:hypothetical protein
MGKTAPLAGSTELAEPWVLNRAHFFRAAGPSWGAQKPEDELVASLVPEA